MNNNFKRSKYEIGYEKRRVCPVYLNNTKTWFEIDTLTFHVI